MAHALAWAKREPHAYSIEMDTLNLLDRFGAPAVFGGPVPLALLRRMQAAETIVAAYRAYTTADNGAEWAAQHPHEFSLLTQAMQSSKPS